MSQADSSHFADNVPYKAHRFTLHFRTPEEAASLAVCKPAQEFILVAAGIATFVLVMHAVAVASLAGNFRMQRLATTPQPPV